MTNPTFIMATMCLNFSYTKLKEKSTQQNDLQLYQYGFSGFKSGYTPSLMIKRNDRGQTLTILNYAVEQLFALAYGAGTPINPTQTIIDVTEHIKLQEIRCYTLFVPQQQIANFYIIMQQNLNIEFPDYIITVQKRGNENYMIIKDIDGYGK